ncbi:MAG TPA: RimK/LysX family protein [Gemmataceae bacterium]|nr:RimK/LysX family protein [Gemmataceae bacterium]
MPITAGWKEYADFPAWGLRRVKVKLDTGARSAAIGVRRCVLVGGPDACVAELHVAPYRRRPTREVVVRVPVVAFKRVRSSDGTTEERPVVEVELRLGPVTKLVRATVANRTRMLVKIILGRHALAPDFVVDPDRKFLLGGK